MHYTISISTLYLLPLQISDFIEAVKLLQTELLVLLFGILVQSLEDAHHLPLGCNGNQGYYGGEYTHAHTHTHIHTHTHTEGIPTPEVTA